MKQTFAERTLAAILLIIAAGIVIHAPLTVWLGTVWPHYAEILKAWKELLMGLALILLLLISYRRGLIRTFLTDHVVQVALIYAGLHFIIMAFMPNSLHAEAAGLLIDLRYVFYFVLVYLTLRMMPHYRRPFLYIIGWGAAVVLGFALLQVFVLPKDILAHIGYGKETIAPYLTVDKNESYIRINSTLRGPNPLGAYVVIVFGLVLAYLVRKWSQISRDRRWQTALVIGACAIVMIVTYSRSSLLGLVVTLAVGVGAALDARLRRRSGIIVMIGLIIVAALLVVSRTNPVVSNVVWHDNPTGGSAVDSNEGHAESLADGTKRLLRQPLGAGIGSTGSASIDTQDLVVIENQYLFIAHETGWLGLALFVRLFVVIMRRLWQRRKSALALGTFAGGCGLALIGLLLPVWADDTVSIIWWGLAAVAIATPLVTKKEKPRGTRARD